MRRLIDAHIVTGFLGAGKTTLINRILKTPEMAKTAVIVNEFGEIGVDHLLVEGSDDTILELSNGCICCSIRGELVDTLLSLVDRDIERIVIETTGIADPGPILQALIGHSEVTQYFRFHNLVVVVDADIESNLQHEEYVQQISLGDRLILTKLDTIEASNRTQACEDAISQLRTINNQAEIIASDELTDVAAVFAPVEKVNRGSGSSVSSHRPLHHHNSHSYRSVSLRCARAIERRVLDEFLYAMIHKYGDAILRVKGLVLLVQNPQMPMIVHAVGRIFEEPERLDVWPLDPPATLLTVITKGVDPEPIRALFDSFTGNPRIDTPDMEASRNNPLSIPGL